MGKVLFFIPSHGNCGLLPTDTGHAAAPQLGMLQQGRCLRHVATPTHAHRCNHHLYFHVLAVWHSSQQLSDPASPPLQNRGGEKPATSEPYSWGKQWQMWTFDHILVCLSPQDMV